MGKQDKIPITTIIRVRPKEGFEKQTFDWFNSIAESASHFPGHLGSEILESCDQIKKKELVNIFYFDSFENLMNWENSEDRNKQVKAGEIFFEQEKPKIQLTGLEFWFENKDSNGNKVPITWKMLIVTIATIFTLLNTLIPLIQGLFIAVGLPELLRSLLSIVILTVTMTYFIMPHLTKLLSGWLFPGNYLKK